MSSDLDLEPAVAQRARDLVELLLRQHPLLFGDPAHRAHVHRRAQFRRHHHRRKRLIDVQEHDLGRKLQRELLGVGQREVRVFGEVGGGDNF